MSILRSFRDLDAYKLAREQANDIFIVSKSFRRTKDFH